MSLDAFLRHNRKTIRKLMIPSDIKTFTQSPKPTDPTPSLILTMAGTDDD